MWYLDDDIRRIEEKGLCSVCFCPIAQGNHQACTVFSGTNPFEEHYQFKGKLLEEFKGNWTELATIAFFNQLIPWGISHIQLPFWFSYLEGIVLEIERGRIPPTKIVKSLRACEGDFFSLRRIARDDRYPFEDFFGNWDPRRPINPVDYYIRQIQVNNQQLSFEPNKTWDVILKAIFRSMELEITTIGNIECPRNWAQMEATTRNLYYNPNNSRMISVRETNQRPIVSTLRDLDGRWCGWRIADTVLSIPSIGDEFPDLEDARHRMIPWRNLIHGYIREIEGENWCIPRNESVLKQIVKAHGMELLGNSNSKKSDDRAMDSHAEFVLPGERGLIDSLEPIADVAPLGSMLFEEPTDDLRLEELEQKSRDFIKKYTIFVKPSCRTQARSIGWILSHHNTLVQTIMPTGTGKSLLPLCAAIDSYVGRGSMVPPLVIVVCPLISLLEDQVTTAYKDTTFDEMRQADRIMCLHSSKNGGGWGHVLDSVTSGKCILLFLTAEQLQTEKVLQAINTRTVSWIFIDEAHGIVEFEDYRPAYSRIWYPIRRIKCNSPKMGLEIQTATLPSKWERKVWEKLLCLGKPPQVATFRSSAIRKNLEFRDLVKFRRGQGEQRNRQCVRKAIELANEGKKVIIYSIYKSTDSIFDKMYSELLKGLPNKRIGCYSGDGSKKGKESIDRETFVRLFSKDEFDVTLATMAFGLGIDKPDIEAIVFNGIPSSVNTLYQQAGRAARGLTGDLKFKYKGDLYIFTQPDQDLGHQRTMSSQKRYLPTTTTKLLETMIMSKQSSNFGGLHLLDLTALDDSSEFGGATMTTLSLNKGCLRILSEVEAIDWVATLPDLVTIHRAKLAEINSLQKDDFLSNGRYQILSGDYLNVEISELIRYSIRGNYSLSDIYELIEDVSGTSSESFTGWDSGGSKALVVWLWDGTKEDLEKRIAIWRITDEEEYNEEEENIRRLLHEKDNAGRMDIISKYYNFCSMYCNGCEGCK